MGGWEAGGFEGGRAGGYVCGLGGHTQTVSMSTTGPPGSSTRTMKVVACMPRAMYYTSVLLMYCLCTALCIAGVPVTLMMLEAP